MHCIYAHSHSRANYLCTSTLINTTSCVVCFFFFFKLRVCIPATLNPTIGIRAGFFTLSKVAYTAPEQIYLHHLEESSSVKLDLGKVCFSGRFGSFRARFGGRSCAARLLQSFSELSILSVLHPNQLQNRHTYTIVDRAT